MKKPHLVSPKATKISQWLASCREIMVRRELSVFGGFICSVSVVGVFALWSSGSDSLLNRFTTPNRAGQALNHTVYGQGQELEQGSKLTTEAKGPQSNASNNRKARLNTYDIRTKARGANTKKATAKSLAERANFSSHNSAKKNPIKASNR